MCIRMTSCVLSLFFLVSLCSSVTADPTGIKVRITDKALDLLKEFGVAFLGKLVNKPFIDLPLPLNFNIKGLQFKHLTVTPDQVLLTFQKDSGLKFEIKDLNFAGELHLSSKKTDFEGKNLIIKIDVELKQDQGHPTVEIPNCEMSADQINIGSNGLLGLGLDVFKTKIQDFLTKQICPALKKYAVPKANSMLKDVTTVMKPYKGLDINIDSSLSGDVAVTPNSLDVPFKGLVSLPDQAVNTGLTGTDLFITENNQMAYVAASEVFFNSAAQSLFSAGAMKKTIEVTHPAAKAVLNALHLIREQSQLKSPVFGTLEVTKAPSFSISKKDGVTVKIEASGQVSPEGATDAKNLVSVSLSATCNVKDIQVSIAGECLSFASGKVSCTTDAGNTVKKYMVNTVLDILMNKVTAFLHGLMIPLPDGISFTVSDIYYHDTFLVVGGSVYLGPDMKEKLLETFSQLMKSVFKP